MTDTATPPAGPGILYIAGYGRSGSTLLDALLGNHPRIFGGGELTWLFLALDENRDCSCGAPMRECSFWREVVGRLRACLPGFDPRQAEALTRWCETTHTFGRSRRQPEYLRLWRATYESIRDVSGRPWIVDSSKGSLARIRHRMGGFHRDLGLPFRVLHLLRSPRSVLRSVERGDNRLLESNLPARVRFARARTLVHWALTNRAIDRVRDRSPSLPYRRLTYEALCESPAEAFRGLGDFLELDPAPILDELEGKNEFMPGHGVAGNRMRRAGPIRFRPDAPDRDSMPHLGVGWRWLFGPLLRRYGYA